MDRKLSKLLNEQTENKQEQPDKTPLFKSGQTLSCLESRSTSSQPNNARDGCKKKVSDAVSEHRDSSYMNEGKYNRAPPEPHDLYAVADCRGDSREDSGAADLDFDNDMSFWYGDERASEGLARVGERVEEDGREGLEGEDDRKEPQEAERGEAAEQVDYEEASFFKSDQLWNSWSKEFSDERIKIGDMKGLANAGHKASIADRLLAAWTTVKPVI